MLLFRQLPFDWAVFATAGLLIVLLNAGQYFVGYGGFGLVEGTDPWALTFGFPFSYYEWVFRLHRGRILYLGILGNLAFAIAIGVIASLISSLIKSRFLIRPK